MSEQEWRHKYIARTHTRAPTLVIEPFMEYLPTYMLHIFGSNKTLFYFSVSKCHFIFVTNFPPQDNLLFTKWPSAQITGVLIPSRLENYIKYSTCHWQAPDLQVVQTLFIPSSRQKQDEASSLHTFQVLGKSQYVPQMEIYACGTQMCKNTPPFSASVYIYNFRISPQ